jgi:hypothetical protein
MPLFQVHAPQAAPMKQKSVQTHCTHTSSRAIDLDYITLETN